MFILQMQLRHMTDPGWCPRHSIYQQLPQGLGLMEPSGCGPPLPARSRVLAAPLEIPEVTLPPT